jgi:hypothetical protein
MWILRTSDSIGIVVQEGLDVKPPARGETAAFGERPIDHGRQK